MKRSIIFALALAMPSLYADEVKMKDGSVYKNCTIESETDTEYNLLVPVSKSIKDSIVVKKDDVESVTRASDEEIALEKLQKKYQNINDLKPEGLETALAELDKLVASTPKDGKTAALYAEAFKLQNTVKSKLDALVEKDKAAEEAKAAEAAKVNVRNKYDYEANTLFERMKKLNVDGKQVLMLEIYDRLSTDYPGADATSQAHKIAVKVIPALNESLKKQIKTLEAKLDKERKTVQAEIDARRANNKLTPEQREALQEQSMKKLSAITDRETKLRDQYRTICNKLREKQRRWFVPPAGCVDAMKDLQRLAEQELAQIKKPLDEVNAFSGQATKAMETAWQLSDEGKFDEAREQVQILKAVRVPGEYYEELDNVVYEGQQDLRVKEREARAAAAAKERERIAEEQRLAREGKTKPAADKKDEAKSQSDDKPAKSSKKKATPSENQPKVEAK